MPSLYWMTPFLEELRSRIALLQSEQDLQDWYGWVWAHQADVAAAIDAMNTTLGLTGDCVLQPDLPLLSNGSRNGLLVLAANPGWRTDLNALEDAYCRRSADHYNDLMLNYFSRHPVVVGRRINWWSKPFWFVRLLPNGSERFGSPSGAADRWRRAHESKLIGGWELFPFHSSSDGFTPLVPKVDWLRALIVESVRAALRFSPQVLFVASKAGWKLVRHHLLPELPWQDQVLGGKTPISYTKNGSTEIIAIGKQIFSAHRNFTNNDILACVVTLRNSYQRSGLSDD